MFSPLRPIAGPVTHQRSQSETVFDRSSDDRDEGNFLGGLGMPSPLSTSRLLAGTVA
jgi:hypothetical protein